MRHLVCFATLATYLACTSAAISQPQMSVESVVVHGRRYSNEDITKLVAARVAPTFLLGKVANWRSGICPVVQGLKTEFTDSILKRIKDLASEIGTPVNPDDNCKSNIQVVFTTTPQQLLDGVRKTKGELLGYHDNQKQAEEMARVTRPIQAWYSTETIDARGQTLTDDGRMRGIGCMDPPKCTINLPRARTLATTGSRVGDGLKSGLNNVLIVIEPKKLLGYEVGALADYISFLALAQVRTDVQCDTFPTILNLLRSCPAGDVSEHLTESDLGYLRGVYRITADAPLIFQQNEIAFHVKQTLKGAQ